MMLSENQFQDQDTGSPAYRNGLPQRAKAMTMRDCFACAAMQAAITRGDDFNRPGIAAWAYSMADAMLKELEKQHTKG